MIGKNKEKDLSLCHKLRFSNPEIFATRSLRSFIVLDQIVLVLNIKGLNH